MATYTCTCKNMYTCIEGSYRVVPIHGYIHVAQCPQAVPLYICNNIIVMEKEAGILWYVLVFGVDMLILLRQWLHRCVQRYAENGRIQKRHTVLPKAVDYLNEMREFEKEMKRHSHRYPHDIHLTITRTHTHTHTHTHTLTSDIVGGDAKMA